MGVTVTGSLVKKGAEACPTAVKKAGEEVAEEVPDIWSHLPIPALNIGFQKEAGVQYFKSFKALKTALGPDGEGMVYHHIVEQGTANVIHFGAEAIHNTRNVIPVPRDTNNLINSYNSSKRKFTEGLCFARNDSLNRVG